MYRGPNGTSCAVGCHIPDEMYKPDMERKSVLQVIVRFPEVEALFNGVDGYLLNDMQNLHDSWLPSGLGLMEGRAKAIASKYNLTYKEPNHE